MKLHLENSDVRQHFIVNKIIEKIDSQLLYAGVFYALRKFEKMHEHNFYEFLLVTSGSGLIKTEKGILEINKGDVVIYPPHNLHIEKGCAETSMCAYFFTVKASKKIIESFDKEIKIVKTGDDFISFSKTFDMLTKYARIKDDDYSAEVASVAANLLLSLIIKCMNNNDPKNNNEKSELHKIKKYIDEHYCEDINIDSLGKEFGFSNYYLCRAYKDYFGTTIKRYVIEKRIQKAKELAENPNNKLDDVCKMVSYDDRYYFSRLFKKEVGISYKKYVENLKIN